MHYRNIFIATALLVVTVSSSVFAIDRAKIDDKYKWKTEHIYASVEDWEAEMDAIRADVDKFFQAVSGGLGGDIIVARAKATLEKRYGTNFETVSSRDLAQATAYAILTSDKMGISEKRTRMQLLTEKILNINATEPKEVPKGTNVFPEVESPEAMGPSGGPPISTITGKPNTHAEDIMREHEILSGKITDKLPHGGR